MRAVKCTRQIGELAKRAFGGSRLVLGELGVRIGVERSRNVPDEDGEYVLGVLGGELDVKIEILLSGITNQDESMANAVVSDMHALEGWRTHRLWGNSLSTASTPARFLIPGSSHSFAIADDAPPYSLRVMDPTGNRPRLK